jgi:hypothetical protein
MRARRALDFRALRAKESNHEVKRIVDHSGAVLAFCGHKTLRMGVRKVGADALSFKRDFQLA